MLTALCAGGAGVTGLLLGYLSALFLYPKLRKTPPTSRDIARFMESVVNQEDVETRRRLLKRQMLETGRRSVRYDGGPNAKVVRMRKRRRVIVKSPKLVD